MDPPAEKMNRAASRDGRGNGQEKLPHSRCGGGEPPSSFSPRPAARRDRGDCAESSNESGAKPESLLEVPDFKDQARAAGFEAAGGEEAAGDDSSRDRTSILPVARSVRIVMIEEDSEAADPVTQPAAVMQTAPSSGIHAKNAVGTFQNNRRDDAANLPASTSAINRGSSNNMDDSSFLAEPQAAVNGPQVVLCKHLIWAGTTLLIAVAVIVAVVITVGSGEGSTSKTPPPTPTTAPLTTIGSLIETRLIASDGAEDDWFGYSVAIDGDTLVIGAREDDTDSGESSGSAYVFTRLAGAWSEQTKLTASDGDQWDGYGKSVAINENTIVIGAWTDDRENGFDEGSAYVYILSGSVWTEQTKLTASDGGDRFGASVAIHGDTIFIGAEFDDTFIGSAYIYTRSGGVWSEQAKLMETDGASQAKFGCSMAIDGETIVIGAYIDNTANGNYTGSAYVYTYSESAWTKQASLVANDGAEWDHFGYSVAISGDTIIIGAYEVDNEAGPSSGSAYVYARAGTSWTEQVKLTASDGADYDDFGRSVAIDGDIIVIGAQWDDTESGENSGSAYVFTSSGAGWTEMAKLEASDGAADDDFGVSIAIDGDTIVIGAHEDGTENGKSGSVYVFD